MMRWSITIMAIVISGGMACAQESPNGSQVFSSDLIAWSFMQQPQSPEQKPSRQQPTPDPNPETQPAQNPTPAQPSSPGQAQSPAQGQAQAAQTFTGTVSKEADSFVLKVSDTASYKLDNQEQVQEYQGQRVRVTGTLDPSINLIHVDRIEPLS
jgi:hypothetical protein